MKAIRNKLEELVPVGNITMTKSEDGMLILSSPEEGMAAYPEQVMIPLVMDLVAKTDSTNIRLKCGKGQVILNWECNMEEMHVHDPILGNPYGVAGKGLVPVNEFVHIRWIIDDAFMLILVNGEVRLFSENEPYMKLKQDGATLPECTVGVAPAMGSNVTVNQFTVTEWKHDGHKPIALLINDPGSRKLISGIGPNESMVRMKTGESYTLDYAVFPKSAQNCKIKWCTDQDILDITDCADGKLFIVAKEQGLAIIKGEIENEKLSAIYQVKSFIPEFNTNLEHLRPVSGSWTVEDGLLGDGWDNCFMISSVEADHFSYEADIRIENSAGAALVFGADSEAKSYYCVSVCPGRDGVLKLWNSRYVIAEKKLEIHRHTHYHLMVVVNDGHIHIYFDDQFMIEARDRSYTGGYLGLNTFFGKSLFQNVRISHSRK